MSKSVRWLVPMMIAGVLGWVAAPARAAQDMVQFGSTIHVQKASVIHDAVCFFCSVDVDGAVNGDTVVFFGDARINGEAKRDVVVFFGDVKAGNNASIGQNVVNFFGGVKLGENTSIGHDTVVMFGSLEAADSVNFGGNRVVQPGAVFWVPFLAIVFGIYFLVHEVRRSRMRRMMRGY